VGGRLVLLGEKGEKEKQKRNPMVVTWKSFMMYERSTGAQAVFQGDVHVQQTGRDLSARFLRVMFDSDQEPVQVIASGKAMLKVKGAPDMGTKTAEAEKDKKDGMAKDIENWHLTSDRIEGYLQEDRVRATGPGELLIKRANGQDDWIKWKDRMQADFSKSYARFYGEIRSDFGGAKLNSEMLRLDFNANRELRHLKARKEVHFVSPGKQSWKMKAEFAEAIFAPGSVLSQIIARDKVDVRDKRRRLKSEFLILFFHKKSGGKGQSLERALARKNVGVQYEGEEELQASCERLDWDAESDKYRLTGKPAQLKKGKMQMDGGKIIIDRGSGHVSLPGGETPASTSVEE
jgi:lipopolysaccharide export system protein LptA